MSPFKDEMTTTKDVFVSSEITDLELTELELSV